MEIQELLALKSEADRKKYLDQALASHSREKISDLITKAITPALID